MKQELLDKIYNLEKKIEYLETENNKLKEQQNGQLVAQIKVKK